MQKITYENYSNGLSAYFANDSPRSFLAEFDGNSVSSTAITYKPAEFDGERFISANLNSRTITFTAEWYGVCKGKFSIEESFRMWEQLQRVFVPGNMGKLTWTNGRETRFIECRTSELPNFTRVIGNKLSAEFKLVADYPYWQDVKERKFDFSKYSLSDTIIVTNECGIAVPFMFTCSDGNPVLANMSVPAVIALNRPENSTAVVIDTRNCTVTAGGELCNQYLDADSTFFKLLPGENEMYIGNWGSTNKNCFMTWHNHYLGVNC